MILCAQYLVAASISTVAERLSASQISATAKQTARPALKGYDTVSDWPSSFIMRQTDHQAVPLDRVKQRERRKAHIARAVKSNKAVRATPLDDRGRHHLILHTDNREPSDQSA